MVEVGSRIRALREGMGYSLRDLAERSGVSAPMLSQVERGETSPTLAVASKIASGLELSLSQLLRLDESGSVMVVPANGRLRGGGARGPSYEVVPRGLPGQRAEVSLHVLKPGAATGGADDPPIHEPGARETAGVTGGSLRLVGDGGSYELAGGDSITFDADLPHHFENPDGSEARFTAVVAAGLRR